MTDWLPRWRARLATASRRALYPLAALPVGVIVLVLGTVGGHRAAASVQRGLLRRLLAVSVPRPATGRTLAHALLSLPVNAVAFVVAGYVWLLLPVNFGYPLRPDVTADSLQDAWGGPTLAGAWAVHAAGAAAIFVLVGLPVMNGLAWLQGRLARRMFEGPTPARASAAPSPADA